VTPTPAVVYTKAGCPHSDAIRAELVASGTAFREIDVEREPRAIPELLKLTRGRRIVPVVVRAGAIEVAPRGGSTF
jgi:glutaredoxin